MQKTLQMIAQRYITLRKWLSNITGPRNNDVGTQCSSAAQGRPIFPRTFVTLSQDCKQVQHPAISPNLICQLFLWDVCARAKNVETGSAKDAGPQSMTFTSCDWLHRPLSRTNHSHPAMQKRFLKREIH